MKFLSDILAKAGLTVDGVVTLNNTATGQTPNANDNSTKLATTAWVRTFVQPYSLPIASASTLGGIKVGTGLSIDSGSGVLSVTGGGAASIKSTQTFTATGGQTVFTITGGYIVGLIDVFLNGVYLSPNQTTATNGTSITLGDAALAGDIIDVIIASPVFQGATTTTDQLPEGVVNLYYTNARARAAITLTVNGSSGASSYSSSTGVLNVPTYTLAGLGGIGGSGTTGYISKFTNSTTIGNSLIYDNGTGIGINTSSPYNTSFYSLDINGALLVKNVGKAANITLINADPAGGGNNAFVIHTVGGTLTSSYVDIQGYYGASITGSTTIRLNAAGGNLLVGSLIGTGTRMVVASSTGILSAQAILTISDLSGVPTSRTLTINGTTYDLTADRTWTLTTANISEVTNLYYTDARARAAISVTGSGSYNSSTGVITVTGGVTSVNTLTGAVVLTTTNIAEGTNLYYTDARVGTYLTTNSYATQTYVGTQIANLVAAAPATLDTLNELAAALGNDPNFATTVATSIGTKVPQTRTLTINGTTYDLSADRSWSIAAGVTSFNTRTGAITLTSGDVTGALGYTPYNSTNPNGYISSYTETDTLATVTARGASTSTNSIFSGGLQSRRNQTDNNYTTAALWTESFGNTTTGIAFHISGVVGKFLEMRTNGTLYWENSQVWTSGTLTNLNQLTNGPGYVTDLSGYVTLATTQTITGKKTFSNAFGDSDPVVAFTGTSSASFQYITTAYNASISAGQTIAHFIGRASSSRMSAYIGYQYAAADSNSNFLTLGHWGYDHLIKLYPTGQTIISGNISAANLSGTNTGDQTNISGNAATAGSSSFLSLQSTANLRTITSAGIYREEQPDSGFYYTTTLNMSSSDGRQQLTIARGGDGMKFRGTTSGSGDISWSSWKTVWHSDNLTNLNQLTNGPGYITGESDTLATVTGRGATFNTNLTSGNGNWIKFYSANETDGNDGKIGSGPFGSGLNIVGSQTTAGTGRQIRLWGTILDNGGNIFLHSGNIGSYAVTSLTDTLATVTARGASTASGITFTAPGGSILLKHAVSEVDAWIFQENAANWGLYWKNNPSGNHTFGGYTTVGAELFGMSAANASGNGVLTSNFVGATSAYAQWMLSNYTGYIWSASTIYAATSMIVGGSTVWHAGNLTNLNQLSNGPGYLTSVGIGNITDAHRFWNNMGNNHSTHTDFNSVSNFGFRYIQGSTNGPGTGSTQFYGMTLGLGNDYAYGTYAMQLAIPRYLASDKYITFRTQEAGTWSGWTKISAGYADSAGSLSNMNISQFTNNSGYITAASNVQGLSLQGLGNASVNVNNGASGVYRNENGAGGNLSYAPVLHLGGGDTMWQIQGDYYNSSTLQWRAGYAGSWYSWRQILHTGNLSSYVVPVGGGTFTGNVKINPVSESWAEGLTFMMPSTTTWGGLRWQRQRAGYDGNWAIGYTALDATDDLVFIANNGGAQVNNILRLTKAGNVSTQGSFTASGDVTAYSDARIKENIFTIDNALEKMLSLRGVYYNRTDKDDKSQKVGVIAQEIQQVLPQVVQEQTDGMLSVSYGNMAGLFIEAIKEQQTQIESQKSEIDVLKDLVQQLINR